MKREDILKDMMLDATTKTSNVIMISKEEIISPIEMFLRNANIAALMLIAASMRKKYYTESLSLQCALNEAALFAMTNYFQSDEERLEYLRVTIPAIRGFYADGFNILINPNWDDHKV